MVFVPHSSPLLLLLGVEIGCLGGQFGSKPIGHLLGLGSGDFGLLLAGKVEIVKVTSGIKVVLDVQSISDRPVRVNPLDPFLCN